jgi:hypothetical protein
MQYAVGGHRPTDLENIISDRLQYNTIANFPSPPPKVTKYNKIL